MMWTVYFENHDTHEVAREVAKPCDGVRDAWQFWEDTFERFRETYPPSKFGCKIRPGEKRDKSTSGANGFTCQSRDEATVRKVIAKTVDESERYQDVCHDCLNGSSIYTIGKLSNAPTPCDRCGEVFSANELLMVDHEDWNKHPRDSGKWC